MSPATYHHPCFFKSLPRYWSERRMKGTRKNLCGRRGGRDGAASACTCWPARGGRGGASTAVERNKTQWAKWNITFFQTNTQASSRWSSQPGCLFEVWDRTRYARLSDQLNGWRHVRPRAKDEWERGCNFSTTNQKDLFSVGCCKSKIAKKALSL